MYGSREAAKSMDFGALPMEASTVFILVALYVLITVRRHIDASEKERLDAWNADRKYETKMRFKSEWREREGAEAIYRESGIALFALVRIHSIDADGYSVDIYLERIPWPGLPVSAGWPVREKFDVGSGWDYFSIGRNYWVSSPYSCWMLIFDPETIQAFKAVAVEFQNETEAERWKGLRGCLRAWDKKRRQQELAVEASRNQSTPAYPTLSDERGEFPEKS